MHFSWISVFVFFLFFLRPPLRLRLAETHKACPQQHGGGRSRTSKGIVLVVALSAVALDATVQVEVVVVVVVVLLVVAVTVVIPLCL